MKKVISHQDGFSLIESLIVLSVILLFSHLSIITFHTFYTNIEKNLFFEQLQTDLYYAKSLAINRETVVTVVFLYDDRARYEISAYQYPEDKIIRDFPESIKLLQSNLKQFHFTQKGTISQFGTIRFQHEDQIIQLVITIGQGRFTLNE